MNSVGTVARQISISLARNDFADFQCGFDANPCVINQSVLIFSDEFKIHDVKRVFRRVGVKGTLRMQFDVETL